ncbi:hypothetical protein K438DRAFT_1980529 [Mycena galopus ATCC 62051]|nr:hypothetical protein K438DRAFT_1980529 [Mycena galopus ATCC 62051]
MAIASATSSFPYANSVPRADSSTPSCSKRPATTRVGSHFSIACFLDEAAQTGDDRGSTFFVNSHPVGALELRQIMTKVLKALRRDESPPSTRPRDPDTPDIPHLESGAILEMGYPHLCAINVDTTVHTVQGAQLVPFFLDVLTRLLKSYFVANGEDLTHFIVNNHFGALESEDEIWAELRKLVGKLDSDIRGWEYAPLVHNPQYHTLIVGD